MKIIQDSELILYKAFANHIKAGLEKPLNKLNLKCLEEFSKFEKQNALFLNCETYEDLGDNSKKLKKQKQKLLELLAVQDRIEKILKRNEQRLEFANSRLSQVGIYNDAVDKKTFSSELSKESKNVGEEQLNLNPMERGAIVFKFFAGEILAFKDGVLDLSLEENENALVEGSAEFFHEVIFTFPYAVSTIPDEIYLVSSVKNKILKECVLYVASKLKVQSIYDSNKELGGLLANASQISDISEFARELRNYFNVVVKQCIKRQSPELAEEADHFLRCYEGTEFLPIEKRVSGAAIDDFELADETQEFENEKSNTSESEEELQGGEESDGEEQQERPRSKKELVDLLLADEDDDELLGEDESGSEEQVTSENESQEDELGRTLRELEELLLSDDEDDDEKGDVNG